MTLRVTPAMAASLTDRVWVMADIVRLLEDIEMPVPVAQATRTNSSSPTGTGTDGCSCLTPTPATLSGCGARSATRPATRRLILRCQTSAQASAHPGGWLQPWAAAAPPDRRRHAPEPAGAGSFGGLRTDRPSDRPLGTSDGLLGVRMETRGVRRLNRSSPSCLNRPAQRTDFFHGLVYRPQEPRSRTRRLVERHRLARRRRD